MGSNPSISSYEITFAVKTAAVDCICEDVWRCADIKKYIHPGLV
jgi:hypothetical protein